MDLFSEVERLFPPGSKIISFNGSPRKYTALLRCKCQNKEEFREKWLKEFEKLSRVSMRVLLTRPKTGKTVVYKAAYRCQHNTYPESHQRVKSPHRKHTGCSAVLKVTIKASPGNRRVRSMDKLRLEYPTIISINHDHNHSLPREKTLKNERQYKIGKETMEDSDMELDNEDWESLKLAWNSILDKWESSNSRNLHKAFRKAAEVLNNCKTVRETVAALNGVEKIATKEKKTGSSDASRRINCSNEKQTYHSKFDGSDPVDEMLVIDQGWII